MCIFREILFMPFFWRFNVTAKRLADLPQEFPESSQTKVLVRPLSHFPLTYFFSRIGPSVPLSREVLCLWFWGNRAIKSVAASKELLWRLTSKKSVRPPSFLSGFSSRIVYFVRLVRIAMFVYLFSENIYVSFVAIEALEGTSHILELG